MNALIQKKVEHFFDTAPVEDYLKGQILTFAGEEPVGVSLLVQGLVEQYDITPDGNKITVNVFKPPAFYPMSWAINKTPNKYFFAAMTNVQLRTVSSDKAVTFLQQNPDVMFDLLSRVYIGTDALLQRLTVSASKIAANRLIFELLIEAYRFGVDSSAGSRAITLKQNALAERCGLARETVSRELHKLEDEGLITRNKQHIEIDLNALEAKINIRI